MAGTEEAPSIQKQKQFQGATKDLSSDITDWSDLRKFDNIHDSEQLTIDENKLDQNQGQDATTDLPAEFTDRSDIRKFNNVHEVEQFTLEENTFSEEHIDEFITQKGASGYSCKLCSVLCCSEKDMKFHRNGIKHRKAVEYWKHTEPKPFVDEKQSHTSEDNKLAAEYGKMFIKTKSKEKDNGIDQYFCTLCRELCDREKDLKFHLNEIKHRKAVEYWKHTGRKPFVDEKQSRTSEDNKLAAEFRKMFIKMKSKEKDSGIDQYFCTLCAMWCGGKKSVDQHRRGSKHLAEEDTWEARRAWKKRRRKPFTNRNQLQDAADVTDSSDERIFNDIYEWCTFEENKLAELYDAKFVKVIANRVERKIEYFCELCSMVYFPRKSWHIHCRGLQHLKRKEIWKQNGKKPFENKNKFEDATADVTDCSDKKKFDDIHEWCKFEENKLAEKYGGKFVKVIVTSDRKIDYYCELCKEYYFPRKSLDVHCGGLEHLKRQDYWEEKGQRPFERYDHSSHQILPGRKRLEDPSKIGRKRPLNAKSSWFVNPWLGKTEYYGCEYRFDYDKESNAGGAPTSSEAPKSLVTYGRCSSSHSSSPSERRSSRCRSSRGRDYDKEYDRRKRRRNRSRRSRSPEKKSSKRSHSPRRSLSPPGVANGRKPVSTSVVNKSPSPVRIQQPLASSPAGTLLQKLSECYVKTEEEADLALSVTEILAKSLKDYFFDNGHVTISELLVEIQLKTSVVKALTAGMKLMDSVTLESFTKERKYPP